MRIYEGKRRLMKIRNISIATILAFLLTSSCLFSGSEYDLSSLVKGNNTFCFDLYAHLKSQQGNLFFSPYSITSALAMTYAGSRSKTETQMAQVLHFPKDQKVLHPAFSQLQNDLNTIEKKGNIQLSIANAL